MVVFRVLGAVGFLAEQFLEIAGLLPAFDRGSDLWVVDNDKG